MIWHPLFSVHANWGYLVAQIPNREGPEGAYITFKWLKPVLVGVEDVFKWSSYVLTKNRLHKINKHVINLHLHGYTN